MSEPARQRNVRESLARAEQALRVAEAALAVGGSADAISRAYYACFHYLRAALFARGLEVRTHSGAQNVFNREFIASGDFPARHNKLIAGLQRQRELADYEPAMVFDPADVQKQIADVCGFGAEVVAWLQGQGLA